MTANIADLVLVRLANIEHKDVVPCIEAAFECNNINLGNLRVARRHGLLASDSAELVIVNQFSDRRIDLANRALGIPAYAHFAETHSKRIQQHQTAHQRFARTQNQLHNFCCRDHSEQSGQHSKHAAFGAGGNPARRWRLRKEAPIAWTILASEYARLPFETEDGSIDIRLTAEHGCVVHQIARGEVVGSIGIDVKTAEDIECTLAVETGVELLELDKWIDDLQLVDG